ncbi:MAG: LAGLIDADG family homing endonuclease [Candidatus Hodarchaeales archaeon]
MTRIYAEKTTWKRVYQDLKNRGFSLVKINEKIGTQIQRQLYQGYGMNLESFTRLQQLVDFSIPTIPNPYWNEQIVLKKDENLAEMIGIILGDGNIDRKVILISFHSEATEYIDKVSLLVKTVFKYDPKFHRRKKKNIIEIKIHSVVIVQSLLQLGLKMGDKVKNQVAIPKWIKTNDTLFISCIRGLIDTDGYIGKYKKKNAKHTWFQYHVGFTNYSMNLINDFVEFCERFEIPYSHTQHKVIIGSKMGVSKILKITRPFKLSKVNFDLQELEIRS